MERQGDEKNKKNKKFCEGSRPPWAKIGQGSPLPYLLQSANPQPIAMPICPFIYINGRAYKECAKVKNMVPALPFCIPTLTPKFQSQTPYFCPHFSAKTPIPRTKTHAKAGTLISPAPIFTSAGSISVHDAGGAFGCRSSGTSSGRQARHCRHTKTDLSLKHI